MGYQITLEENPIPSQKSASGENFSRLGNHAYQIAPQSLNLPREKSITSTTTASGRPFWLSRDPIQERGGINLYALIMGLIISIGWVYKNKGGELMKAERGLVVLKRKQKEQS